MLQQARRCNAPFKVVDAAQSVYRAELLPDLDYVLAVDGGP